MLEFEAGYPPLDRPCAFFLPILELPSTTLLETTSFSMARMIGTSCGSHERSLNPCSHLKRDYWWKLLSFISHLHSRCIHNPHQTSLVLCRVGSHFRKQLPSWYSPSSQYFPEGIILLILGCTELVRCKLTNLQWISIGGSARSAWCRTQFRCACEKEAFGMGHFHTGAVHSHMPLRIDARRAIICNASLWAPLTFAVTHTLLRFKNWLYASQIELYG